jgi:hypothetical protein
MVSEIQNRGSNNQFMANRQPRAATQGGHIFNAHMARGAAYHMGSKLNKLNQPIQKHIPNQENSLSNGYLMSQAQSNGSHGSPKFNGKTKYFSNQPLMNMKFPTTSHGNRSSTNHNPHYTNMHNVVLSNIQKQL